MEPVNFSKRKLINNLYLKKKLLETQDQAHQKIKPVLLILSGGMRGVGSGGVMQALHQLGLANVFEVIIGVSTGAPVGAYFLAGPEKTSLGTSIYYQDLPSKFIKYLQRPIVNLDYLENLFRLGRKKLDVLKVKQHRSDFFVALTKTPSAEGVLLNAKKTPDMVTAIKASTSLPGLLYGKSTTIEGQPFVDGAIANYFPAQQVIEKFKPTDLLIIANRPFRKTINISRSLIEKKLTNFLFKKTPPLIKAATVNRKIQFKQALNFLESVPKLNWEIIYSPDLGIHLLSRNATKLHQLVKATYRETLNLMTS